MSDTSLPQTFDRQTVLSIGAAIATIVAVGIGLSLSIPLLSFELDAKGASRTVIGFNTAMGGLASILCAPYISGWARRFGMRRLLGAAIALGMVTLLAFRVVEPLWAWFPLRLLFGMSLAILFVISEYWINAAAPEARRGLILGIYASALSIGFAIGPLLLTAAGTQGWLPYLAGAALFGLATLPVALAGGNVPAITEKPSAGITAFLWAAPAGTIAALIFGAVETGTMALLPLYGTAIGLDPVGAVTLVSAFVLGNVLFQIPMGLIADRVDRRWVLIFCATIGALGMLIIATLPLNTAGLMAVLFCWGGIVAGMYTVGLAHLGSSFRGADLAQANAAFVVMYSMGLVIGPPLAGFGMDVWPPRGFAATLASLFVVYLVIVLGRMAMRRSV